MTDGNQSTDLFSPRLAIRIAVGLVIGFLVISFLIFRANAPQEWGEYWRVRPLIVTPLAGAMCGTAFHIIHCFFYWMGWKKLLATVAGILVYIVGLWMGTILGLVGTMWN